MKTMLFLLEKRCRNPKMRGLATASGSAMAISDYRKYALAHDARFFIVSGDSAADGKDIIRTVIKGLRNDVREHDNGHTITVGELAYQALCGAQVAIGCWNTNLEKQGRVFASQTIALKR